MLQNYLDIGMLPIGEDDQKFKYLTSAAKDLADDLLQNKLKIIEYTLVALDPEIAPDVDALQNVEEALKKYWSTYKNKFRGETPRQILRAVIFESLHTIGAKDEDAAAIISLTGSSFLPCANLDRERSLCTSFLTEMGKIAETKAVSEWINDQEHRVPRMPVLKLDLTESDRPKVDRTRLTSELAAASGPENEQNQASRDPNPNWPNSPQLWAYKFAPRAAEGITDVMDQVLAETIEYIFESVGDLDRHLTKHAEATKARIKVYLKQITQSVETQDRRNRLLWWRQTLYSPSTRQGYRSMEATARVLSMAYDLHTQVTPHSPQSVEYLLREAVGALSRQAESESLEVGAFCKQVATIRSKTLPSQFRSKPVLTEAKDTNRIPLLAFVRLLLLENATASGLDKLTGIDSNFVVSPEDLAVWIYRDLQAERLAGQ